MDEFERRKKQQKLKTGRKAGPGAAFQRKDDDFTKDAKKFKKFVEASRAAKVETAKDKVSPMKAQRHFMDTSKYSQKENVKKMFETGADPKTGQKLKTKISLNRIKDTFKNHPKMLKEKVEDKATKEEFRSKIQQQLPNFNTGNNTLDSLLNETAVSPSNEEVFAANDPVNQFINKDYGPLMNAMEKNKNFRP